MKLANALLLLLALSAVAAAGSTPGRAEQAFTSGGHITMELGGGGYEIKPGAADKIVVTYTTEHPEQMDNVEVRFVGGRDATRLKVHGPHNSFNVVIEIPARTDLNIRLEAGELRLRGIEGNKDIESHAGDMDLEVGPATNYSTIDASVGAGDLNAPAFHVNKGGLFRSFKQHGTGKYRLHAHLGAGDLNLR